MAVDIIITKSGLSVGPTVGLTANEITEKVTAYFERMDTVPTREWCTCPWTVHPDDLKGDVEEGKRRLRRADTDSRCPIHSREGMILFFLTWAMEN